MENLEVNHDDFVEEILTGDYYSYYVIEYQNYSDEERKTAFVSIDFERSISENKSDILLKDYRKAETQYINTNIPFGEYPPFQVSHIQPRYVKCFFKVTDKAKELIAKCMFENRRIYDVLEIYKELLKPLENEQT